jgi:hypothetical protein
MTDMIRPTCDSSGCEVDHRSVEESRDCAERQNEVETSESAGPDPR